MLLAANQLIGKKSGQMSGKRAATGPPGASELDCGSSVGSHDPDEDASCFGELSSDEEDDNLDPINDAGDYFLESGEEPDPGHPQFSLPVDPGNHSAGSLAAASAGRTGWNGNASTANMMLSPNHPEILGASAAPMDMSVSQFSASHSTGVAHSAASPGPHAAHSAGSSGWNGGAPRMNTMFSDHYPESLRQHLASLDRSADEFSAPLSTPAARHTRHHVVTGGETVAPRGCPKLFSPGSIERGHNLNQSGKQHGTSFHQFSSPEMGLPLHGNFVAGAGTGLSGGSSQNLQALSPTGEQSLQAPTGESQPPESVADNLPTIPRGKSIIHHELAAGNIVFFSIDLEHGGSWAGILQLSAQAFLQDGTILGEFNRFVKPPEGAHVPASLTGTHGLTQHSNQI